MIAVDDMPLNPDGKDTARWPPEEPAEQIYLKDHRKWTDSPWKTYAREALVELDGSRREGQTATEREQAGRQRKQLYAALIDSLRRINERALLIIKRGLDYRWEYLPVYRRGNLLAR